MSSLAEIIQGMPLGVGMEQKGDRLFVKGAYFKGIILTIRPSMFLYSGTLVLQNVENNLWNCCFSIRDNIKKTIAFSFIEDEMLNEIGDFKIPLFSDRKGIYLDGISYEIYLQSSIYRGVLSIGNPMDKDFLSFLKKCKNLIKKKASENSFAEAFLKEWEQFYAS